MKTGNNTFIPVGAIVKAHGLDGEVVVNPLIDYPDQLENQPIFYMRNKRGDWLPVRVKTGRLQRKGNKTSFFVKFVQITDRNEAERITDQEIYLPAAVAETMAGSESDLASYIGFQVVSSGEDYGEVLDIIDNPAHPILEVSGNQGRFLIPMVDAYIVKIDEERHRIIGRNLEQLTRV